MSHDRYPWTSWYADLRCLFQPGRCLELWGRAEVAEYLGIRQSNMPSGLPEPVFTRPKRRGSFWLASDIRAFARERGNV